MNARYALSAVLFAALIAAAAQVSVPLPGTDIPQTLQTVAVLLAGAVLGFNAASVAIVMYLLAGAVGLEVFADGRSGARVLFGPSGGYLLGFWFAAVLLGFARDRGWLRRWPVWLPAWMLLGHAIILGVGAGLLAVTLGPTAAWFNGIVPFLSGALVKSLLAAALVFAWQLIGPGVLRPGVEGRVGQ